ncbi:hypothetical protein [Mycolicibacterium setense]|uniref:hypothetical protein n=1 Tax=Mycolicibacterium setense TaxID=431269 RepID=UPI00057421B5|nr:hypothetical protein [Mycolicibacterium setense]KHO22148.1 hypothetical protein QQ25_17130 [Mycolicibacterium setense]MCV7113603.1 hypothetical protein [Mycolicibacterium setense]
MTVPTILAAQRFLCATAWAFLLGWGLHVIDHLRRGMSASPTFIMAGGMIQGVVVVIAITMALRSIPRAPEAAIFAGVGSALVFSYAHLLPNFWPSFQDSFISGPRINVTWFSWVTALSEIGTGLLFAYAGARARNAQSLSVPNRG